MRKDYVIDKLTAGAGEAEFVEAYWTDVWKRQLELQTQVDRVARQEEYRLMMPYLRRVADAHVVDGGCGLGDWVLALQRDGVRMTGIDISAETIAWLRERYPGVDLRVGDIRATDLPADHCDAYFSWGVFEHFEDGPGACIREARRILKPGGLLFITVPHDSVRQAIRGSLAAPEAAASNRRFYQYRFTRAELADALTAQGMELLDVRPIHKRQGTLRMLQHELRLPYRWRFTRALAAGLALVLPGVAVGHMLFAVARRPATGEAPHA